MVDRIILFKLVDSATRDQAAALIERELAQLPGLSQLRVGLPADEASGKSWDVSCVLSFRDLADHDAALASSAFTTSMAQLIAPLTVVIKAWSFAQK